MRDSEYDRRPRRREIREVRRRIMANLENDLPRYVDSLIERQKRHADRLITKENDPRRAEDRSAD